MQSVTFNDINIVYEDNHILVVVKPQNLPTQADVTGDLDLLTLLKQYLVNKYQKQGEAFLGMVQRLDRPTGGVMVFAKTSKAAARLSEMLKDKENQDFEKKYLAVVCGIPKTKKGILSHYLKKNNSQNLVSIVPMSTEGAKFSELEYRVLEEKVAESKESYALVDINLLTGRSHQARVQMASMSTPIFGDVRYNAPEKTHKFNLALWAYEIKFLHPVTKERLVFRVYPPKELSPWKAFDISRHLALQ